LFYELYKQKNEDFLEMMLGASKKTYFLFLLFL